MHVLLIEPDVLQARTYIAAFQRAGHTTAHASGAQVAVQLADEQLPDVIVLELLLAGHSGVEFLYEFRSYPEWLHVPVVLYTLIPPDELKWAATLRNELGVHRILYKPAVSLAELCSVAQEAARQSQLAMP